MKKLLVLPIALLLSCGEEHTARRSQATYIVKVNYISNYTTAPSDTLSITSRNVPHLFVNNDGVSTLIADHTLNPEAANVRSFQILKITQ
jgi:hypothetical protein